MRPNVDVSLRLGGGAGNTFTRTVAVGDGAAAAGDGVLVGIFGVGEGDIVGAAASAIGNAAMTAAKTAQRTKGLLIRVLLLGRRLLPNTPTTPCTALRAVPPQFLQKDA